MRASQAFQCGLAGKAARSCVKYARRRLRGRLLCRGRCGKHHKQHQCEHAPHDNLQKFDRFRHLPREKRFQNLTHRGKAGASVL